jgi:hypothetical protein
MFDEKMFHITLNVSKSGRTTQLCNLYIHNMFENPNKVIEIEDHFVSHEETIQNVFNKDLFQKIKVRLAFEHPNVFDKIKFVNNYPENDFSICLKK